MRYIIFLLVVFTTQYSKSQTLTDVAHSEELTWYGIDYSEARFVNYDMYFTASTIRRNLSDWSLNPLTNSYRNYIIEKYNKRRITIDLSSSERRNDMTDFRTRIVSETYDLNTDDIKTIVADYDISGIGYGVLLIIEGFDNKSELAYIWVTFINKPDKAIISSKRYVCSNSIKGIKQAIKLSGNFLKKLY